MKYRYCVLFLLAVFALDSSAQTVQPYSSILQTRIVFGINVSAPNLSKGLLTDHMLEYGDKSYSLQLFSLSYFFSQHWGVEVSFQGISPMVARDKRSRVLDNAIEAELGAYYVSKPFGNEQSSWDPFTRGLIGLVYRMENENFFLYPKLLVGYNRILADSYTTIGKRINSNRVYRFEYLPEKSDNVFFASSLSATCGYKLAGRLWLAVDLIFCYNRADMVFVHKIEDLSSGEVFTNTIHYSNAMLSFGASAGFVLVMKR